MQKMNMKRNSSKPVSDVKNYGYRYLKWDSCHEIGKPFGSDRPIKDGRMGEFHFNRNSSNGKEHRRRLKRVSIICFLFQWQHVWTWMHKISLGTEIRRTCWYWSHQSVPSAIEIRHGPKIFRNVSYSGCTFQTLSIRYALMYESSRTKNSNIF